MYATYITAFINIHRKALALFQIYAYGEESGESESGHNSDHAEVRPVDCIKTAHVSDPPILLLPLELVYMLWH